MTMPSKHLMNNDGHLNEDGKELVNIILETLVPVFEDYLDKGYNMFEALGVMTSAIINAQKQAWLNKISK